MANATYEVLEFRAVVLPDWTELYIRCSPDNEGGMLVGGWYKKIIPPSKPSLDALRAAIVSQDFLTTWDRGIPG